MPILLAFLLLMLALHACGVVLDCAAAIRDAGELDYGEGIVWQQAALIPGPSMYPVTSGLPFIVFHYPPVFHLLARAAGAFMPDLFAAGRLVSAVSAAAIAGLVAGLVLAATPGDGTGRATRLGCAAAAGLLAFCAHALRTWAQFMRVDALAVALGLAGVLVAARSDGRWRGTAAALLLCVAAVYCKQTELPAGISVFITAWRRNPRAAFGAGAIALATGAVPLVALQLATHGGFLQNIVGGNINRLDVPGGMVTLFLETPSSPLVVFAILAALRLRLGSRGRSDPPPTAERLAHRAATARAILLLDFAGSSLMLLTVFKSGSNINYFIGWLCVGCALSGVYLSTLAPGSARTHAAFAVLAAYVLVSPVRLLPQAPEAERVQQAALVRQVAEATKPVASENMVLLMRAGKAVTYEPAIVTELAALGRWDERPLVDMIASGGFAFMLTSDEGSGPTPHRSAAVNAAMQRAYPMVEQAGPHLWLRHARD